MIDPDTSYVTPTERRLAERAAAALHWARVRRREGAPAFSAAMLAGRHGWTWRAASDVLRHLELRGEVWKHGSVWCAAVKGQRLPQHRSRAERRAARKNGQSKDPDIAALEADLAALAGEAQDL